MSAGPSGPAPEHDTNDCFFIAEGFFRQTCRHLFKSCPPLPPRSGWIRQHGRFVLTYTLHESYQSNVEQLKRTLRSLPFGCHRHVVSARIRLDDRLPWTGKGFRETGHRWLDRRALNPNRVPWPAFNRWMEVVVSKIQELCQIQLDVRFSRVSNACQDPNVLAFLKRWCLTAKIRFIFTDSVLQLRWHQWLQETYPRRWITLGLHQRSPPVTWLNLDANLVKLSETWLAQYIVRVGANLDRIYLQRQRPNVLVLYHQPDLREFDATLLRVLDVLAAFTSRARQGDNENPMIEGPPSHTKDTVILRLDLTPLRQSRLWHEFHHLFCLLHRELDLVVLEQCPLATNGSKPMDPAYFHWSRVGSFSCLDIWIRDWYPLQERQLRTWQCKVHSCRLGGIVA